jgi:DNA-binding NarL/FixJ family response regulator
MRIVIGEDQALMREGLRLVLERAGFEIAAVAADAIELTRRVRAARPDLVVADIRMPPGLADDGLRAVLELRAERSDLPVIVLSQHVQRQYVTELLEAGGSGSGYVLKQRVADVDAFVDDVRRVHGGATILDPVVVATMMNRPRPGEDRLHALAAATPQSRSGSRSPKSPSCVTRPTSTTRSTSRRAHPTTGGCSRPSDTCRPRGPGRDLGPLSARGP